MMMSAETTLTEAAVMLSHALRTPLAGESVGAEIGLYTLVEKLGAGGFGAVWRATQSEPVQREVALKIIKLGMDTLEVMSRFEQERVALSMMEHPNIARVLDAGATPEGRPFFVMELVRGVPITTYCIEKHIGLEQQLRLFKDVCAGVQHAHQKGIIHRDLKPSNILVAEVDGVPVPKIIDFGIAKAMSGERLTEHTLRTRAEQMIGTPLYMSPEQAEGNADIDTRSDVYALGVLLYEMLAGQPPFDAETLMAAGYEEMLRIIRDEVPVPPSASTESSLRPLGRVAPSKRVTFAWFRRAKDRELLSRDLDLITLRALEKDRARRYESATAFAEDVQRFLNHEPVTARAPSWWYLTQRWARRHRAAAVAMVVSAFAITVGAAVASWQAIRATRSQHETARQLADAEAIAKVINDTLMRFVEFGRDPIIKREELIGQLLMAIRAFDGDPSRKAHLLDQLSYALPTLEAAKARREALALVESSMQESDPKLWEMRAGLGRLLSVSPDTRAEGLGYLKQVADHCTATLPPDDPRRLRALNAYGGNLDLSDRSAEALPILEEVHRLYQRRPERFQLLEIVYAESYYAATFQHLGRSEEALEISQANIKLIKSNPGVTHAEFALTWLTHAEICRSLKRLDEAASAGRMALDISWAMSGATFGRSIDAFDFLIQLETERHNPDAIIQLHRDAVRINDTQRGAGDLTTASAVRACATAMLAANRLDLAESFTQEWLQRVRLTNGTVPDSSVDVLNARVEVLMASKHKSDALPLLNESLATAEKAPASNLRDLRIAAAKRLIAQINGWPTSAELLAESDIVKAFARAKETLQLTETGQAPEGFTLDEALFTAATLADKNHDSILAHEYHLRRYALASAPRTPLPPVALELMIAAVRSCLQLDHRDEAFELYREYMKRWLPANPQPARETPKPVKVFIWTLITFNNYDAAESLIAEWEAQHKGPDDTGATEDLLYYRCQIYYRRGDAAREETAAKALLAIRIKRYPSSPYTGDAHRFVAHALMNQGRAAEAIQHLERAIDLIGGNYVKSTFKTADVVLPELRKMLDEARTK